ncbi:conserved hypothetical protein [Leishmania braziliensis MHOM/BR/75/M2904]|uniref:Uncharacterized protein n=2 Tax=Leishmania braziliensis TaxID=5660 RepID=A4H900_LEIBR|nr:conserved hypothetical protein [Leishmania braziliensis MHOM/BR/75/M2904]CAJ2470040.1 unnamed protein product [Leishmania braziliensis]CAM37869.2 conserved hypothetical protein [Leishmania braziliensis MHOM/BR/75/M2904]SYZ64537.1 hypothetical_protein [Leishmania braziliensis MHOM/BR/75/M2904]
MTSYCEVCQGLYDMPHPHLWPHRSPLSSSPCKRGAWSPAQPSSSPPQQGESRGGRGNRGLSRPRVANRYHDTPRASRSPFLEGRNNGHVCVGPYVCPCQQRRSASMPAVPDSYDTPPYLGRDVSPGMDGDARCGDEQDGHYRCTASPSLPLSASTAVGRGGSPFIERYREDTYSSQRRADGNPSQLDYLRRGVGHGCTYVSPYDDCEGSRGQSGLATDGGGADLLSSSFPPCALVDVREAAAPHYRCTSVGRSPHVWRGGEFGSSIPQRTSLPPHHPSGPPSTLAPNPDNATRYASECAAWSRSRRNTSIDHPSRRISPAADGGGGHGTHTTSMQSATGAGEPSSSQRPPLLPSVTSTTPVSPFVGLTFNAEPCAQTPASVQAPLHYSTHGDSVRQPLTPAGPLLSRAPDSLANLVAKIRAEVSKDATLWVARSPGTGSLLDPGVAKPRATAEEKRKRQHRTEKPQEQGHALGGTSHAEQTSANQATASSGLCSSARSTGAEGAATSLVLVAPRSTSAGDDCGSNAHGSSAAPPAASGRVRSVRSRRQHGSSGKHRRPSRPRRTSSSSSSTCSTRWSSSSSAKLCSTVRRAEAILRRLQDRPRGSGGSCARSLSAEAERTRGFVGDAFADDAVAVDAATVRRRPSTLAHTSARGKSRTGPQGCSARRGHSAPSLPSRPHATSVPSCRSSSLFIPIDASSKASQCAPQRAHAPDRDAEGATREVRQERGGALAVTESRRQHEMWRTTQEHRIERLREGLSALCAAVRKDLQKVREEVGRVRSEANGAAEDTQKRMHEALATALRSNSPAKRATNARGQEMDFHPSSVVAAVTRCTPSDQHRLAMLLLPHFRPLLAEMVQEEVQCQLRQYRGEQKEEQHALEHRLQAYVEEAAVSRQHCAHGDGTVGSEVTATAPVWASFSSAEAFDAHLRATTRAVLLEEDNRWYSLASENERRHERFVQKLQQDWQGTLSTAQAEWKAEWKALLEEEANVWTHHARAPLQKHADLLQDIVKALTHDVTHLQEQQEALSARLSASLRQEREMRGQEQTQLTERVEQRVRQLLPREVESACVRFHALREQRLAGAGSRSVVTELGTPGASRWSAIPTTSAAAATAASSAEELRLSTVQPALEHMRRLLVLHQEMIDAMVESRCRRAEHTVEGNRHVWSQNVAEVRAKLSALRDDVRGALSELCTNLNVASPAL